MSPSEYFQHHLVPFLLVLSRLAGLFVFAPVLGSPVIPARVKALLAFMFSIALYPMVVGAKPPAFDTTDVFTLGVILFQESLIGLVIGLLAAVPLYAAQLAGLVMDHQLGLGLGAIYNPALETEGTMLGDILMYIALSIFLSIGGMDALFDAVTRTYAHVPIAVRLDPASPFAILMGLLNSGFTMAIRVALPVVGMIMLETVASAFITKTMPQINIMSIGFAVKIIAGLLAVVAGLSAMSSVMGDELHDAGLKILEWAGSLR